MSKPSPISNNINGISEQTSSIQNTNSQNNFIHHPISSNESNEQLSQFQSAYKSSVLGSEFFSSLLYSTTQQKYDELRIILEQNKNIDILQCYDSKGFNLLHSTIVNNQTELVKYLLDYAKQFNEHHYRSEQEIKDRMRHWINQQTQVDQYTPLHLASFRGLLDVIILLEEWGADFDIRNSKGSNIVHFAAQGEQPKVLAYYKLKNVDLCVRDDKQATPLHWAAFSGNENSVNFLVSWDVDLNLQDHDGLTPLHLATLMGYSRIVKKLLIRGAKRNITDCNNKTPYDISKEKNYPNIMGMIKQRSCSLAEYCNIRPAFKKTKHPWRQVVLYMLMYWVGVILFIMFYFPFYTDNFWRVYLFFISIFISMVFFVIVWQKDPGYLKPPKSKRNQKDLMKLLTNYNFTQICPDCVMVKPDRSRHCETCQTCVMVYDHHCPWINNCVGARNHLYFYLFITAQWVNLVVIITLILYDFGFNKDYPPSNDHFPWFNQILDDKGHNSTLVVFRDIFSILLLVVSSLFVLSLSFLVFIHTNNLLMNKTTFERFNQHTLQQSSQSSISSDMDDLQRSDLSQSAVNEQLTQQRTSGRQANFERDCHNCVYVCCENQKNEHFGYQNPEKFIEISESSDSTRPLL